LISVYLTAVPVCVATALLSRAILGLLSRLIAALATFLRLLTRALAAGLLSWLRLVLTSLPALLAGRAAFLGLLIPAFFVIARLALSAILILIVTVVRHTRISSIGAVKFACARSAPAPDAC
jgi:hypothetical protein